MNKLSKLEIDNILSSCRERAKENAEDSSDNKLKFMNEYLKLHQLELKPHNHDVDEYEYDGTKITEDDPEIIIHNINHYRLAPKSRRSSPEFGLGSPPPKKDFYFKKIYSRIDLEIAKLEEDVVITLDYLISVDQKYIPSVIKIDGYNILLRNGLHNLYLMGIIDNKGAVDYQKLRPNRFKLTSVSNW